MAYQNNADYVVNINHKNALRLINKLGGKVLTTALMYKLFIPHLKQSAESGNEKAQETLNKMTNTWVEWLEDLVLDDNKVKIGTQERQIALPQKDGGFNISGLNEFGYPNQVRNQGEFYYWPVRGDEKAAIRDWVSGLDLDLRRGPSVGSDWLGVRLAQNFFELE